MRKLGSIAFAAYVGLSALIVGVIASPFLLFGRDAANVAIKFWSRSVLIALKLLTGVSHRVEGLEHLPRGGALVAVNHQSMWETLALFTILPKPVFALKKELTRVPIYGWWALATKQISIDREAGAKALRAMRKQAAARIAEGCQVIVFPEGTRVPPGTTAPFHPGVAGVYTAIDAPCVPAVHDSGLFWRHPGPEKTPGVVTLRFLPPLAPGLDRKAFLRELKAIIDGARPDLIDGGKNP